MTSIVVCGYHGFAYGAALAPAVRATAHGISRALRESAVGSSAAAPQG
jgi:hypothetical protein